MRNVSAPAAISILVCESPDSAATVGAAGVSVGNGVGSDASAGAGGGVIADGTPSISTRIVVELPIESLSPLVNLRGAPLIRSPLRNVPFVESSSTTRISSSSRNIVVFLRESPLSLSTSCDGIVRPIVSSSSSVTTRTPSGASMWSVAVFINDDGHLPILLSASRCPADAKNLRSGT
ncbi:MAG TPA: hypothetical protein PLP07_06080 [Pyrinomonadaceae bacterium]|nr:hypothetical protein [Pyrinomonadaceae bacterium]